MVEPESPQPDKQSEIKPKRIKSSADLLPTVSFTVDGDRDYSIYFSLAKDRFSKCRDDDVYIEIWSLFDRETDEYNHASIIIPGPVFDQMIQDLVKNGHTDFEEEGRAKIEFKRDNEGAFLFRLNSKEPQLIYSMSTFRSIDGVVVEEETAKEVPPENSFTIETTSQTGKTTVTFKYQVSGNIINAEVTASRPEYMADDDVSYIFDNMNAMQSTWRILGEGINLLRQVYGHQERIILQLESEFLHWYSYFGRTPTFEFDTIPGECKHCRAPWKIVEETRPKPWHEEHGTQTATYKCGGDGEVNVVFR